MQSKWIHILINLTLILSTISCKKGSVETKYNPSLIVANNQVIAERAYSHVFNVFFMVVNDPELKILGSKEIFGAQCAYQETPEIKYIIDFGSMYTLCPDEISRKGIITAKLDMDFETIEARADIDFTNYVEDSLMLKGTCQIINSGLSMSMFQLYEQIVSDDTITIIGYKEKHSFQWESQQSYIYLEGMGTPDDFSDDLFEITGESSGKSIEGVVFSAAIEEALGNYFDCNWIRNGRTMLNTPGLDIKHGYIQYLGQDSCTNKVMYNFNGIDFYEEFILN